MIFIFEDFEKERVDSVLNTIYEMNVIKFDNGQLGAVNGMTKSGQLEIVSMQSEEIWTGVTYALSSTMIMEVKFSIKTVNKQIMFIGFYRIVKLKDCLHLKEFTIHAIM